MTTEVERALAGGQPLELADDPEALKAEDDKARRVFALLGVEPVPTGESDSSYRHLVFGLADGTRYDLLEAVEAHVRLLGRLAGVDVLELGPDDKLIVRIPQAVDDLHAGVNLLGDEPYDFGREIAEGLHRAGIEAVVLHGDVELTVDRADRTD